MNSDKSIFKKIFGDEIGEMLQIMFGIGAMMMLFMGGPILFYKCSSSSTDKDYKELATGSRETTKNIFVQLHQYDSLTQIINKEINTELLKEKDLIRKKKDLLVDLKNDFDSIYLTPQQLKIFEAATYEKKDVKFKEWISSSNQWYNIGVSIIRVC
jgi:hypothetical protein